MNSIKRIWKSNIFLTVLSFLTVISLQYCMKFGEETGLAYTNSVISFVCWAALLYALKMLVKRDEWDTKLVPLLRAGIPFSFMLSGAMVVGSSLDTKGFFELRDMGSYLAIGVLSVSGAPFFAWAVNRLSSLKQTISPQMVNRKTFLKVTFLLMMAYIPVLLAVWPGFFSYDAEVETYMVFTDKYSAHHPIAHVALLGWIMKVMYKIIPSYNVGIAVYLLLQMTVVSACFSYMICFLKRVGVNKWIIRLGMCFLAFFPTVSMFVCCTTKDVYFSAGLALFTTLMLEMAEGEGFWQDKKKRVLFAAAVLLILLFRNNGIYAFVVFLPFFAWVYRKYWRQWSKVLAGVFVFYFVFNAAVNRIFHVVPGEKAEMLCVPMQQLARVHAEAKECFDKEDLEIMYSLIPEIILDNYDPKLADNIKVNFLEDNFKSDPVKYMKLWIRMGLRRPDIYVNSVLMNTYDFWYPDTIVDGYTGKWIVTREYEKSSYFAFETERPGIRKSLLPFLEKFYEKISLEIYQQKIPVVSMLFSMGFWLFAYLFMVIYLWKVGCKKQVFAFMLTGLVYLTVLLGPIAIVRYVLYFFFEVPLVAALLFHTDAFSKGDL